MTKIVIEVKNRHEYDVKVTGEDIPPLAGVEDAMNLAMRRFIEFSHQVAQKRKLKLTQPTTEA